VSKRGGSGRRRSLPLGFTTSPMVTTRPDTGRPGGGVLRQETQLRRRQKAPERPNPLPVRLPTPRCSPPLPPPDGLMPTRKLLKDTIDVGGILERNTKDDKTNYRSLVGIPSHPLKPLQLSGSGVDTRRRHPCRPGRGVRRGAYGYGLLSRASSGTALGRSAARPRRLPRGRSSGRRADAELRTGLPPRVGRVRQLVYGLRPGWSGDVPEF
jgi:hypothetical protein